jgi:hypothetical protein
MASDETCPERKASSSKPDKEWYLIGSSNKPCRPVKMFLKSADAEKL